MATKAKVPAVIVCPRCKSKRTWWKGYTPSSKGHRRRRVCFPCGKSFYPKDEPYITIQEYEKRTAHMPSHWDKNTGLCPSVE